MIDVALGLILAFLLVSLITTQLEEALSGFRASRARMLREKIAQMLGHELADLFYRHPLVAALGKDGKRGPSYIPAHIFAQAVQGIVTAAEPLRSPRDTLFVLTDWAAQHHSPLARTIVTLSRESAGDLGQLQTSIERWYDAAMDRVSGSYKRLTSIRTFFLGLLVAVALNVDALRILATLANDPTQREAIAEVAKGTTGGPDTVKSEQIAAALPIGWYGQSALKTPDQFGWAVPGWLLTALAASLGSAFWFDALSRLVNLRSAGRRPETSSGAPIAPASTVPGETPASVQLPPPPRPTTLSTAGYPPADPPPKPSLARGTR